jgi:arylsulfatase A-like enzyme
MALLCRQKKAASHGVTCNCKTHLKGPTLAGELSRAGYQTHLVGKLHMIPFRKLYGFMSADMTDPPVRRGSDGINDWTGDLARLSQLTQI